MCRKGAGVFCASALCRYEAEEERDTLIPTLREVSRQEYLRKREDKKIQVGRCSCWPVRAARILLHSRSVRLGWRTELLLG